MWAWLPFLDADIGSLAANLMPTWLMKRSAGDDPLIWYEGSGVANANRRYLHADRLGSIVAVTDYQGNLIAANAYDEYGAPD